MVEINNLTTNRIDENFLGVVAKIVIKGENKEEAGLSIAFIGQGRMRKLNKKYRGKNRVTDVLSFGKIILSKHKFPVISEGKTELGEVVICLREVAKNAKKFKVTSEQELSRILIHGILHLLGYDHEKSEKEAERMEEKQEHYFRILNLGA